MFSGPQPPTYQGREARVSHLNSAWSGHELLSNFVCPDSHAPSLHAPAAEGVWGVCEGVGESGRKKFGSNLKTTRVRTQSNEDVIA